AIARVFEVAPNTVLSWLVEAAEQLRAFSAYLLCDLHVNQLQLDELYAVLSAVKDGEMSEAEAIQRLERARHWVWTAMDPTSKLLLAIDVGPRTRAMAQRVGHQVMRGLAPGCVPLCDGWVQGVSDGNPDAFWLLDTTRTAPGQRASAQAAVDATARAALCASGEVIPASASRRGEAPRGVRHSAGHGSGTKRLLSSHCSQR